MTDIHIPPAALEAGRKAFTEAMLTVPQPDPIRAAFVAMVEAWEGMHMEDESAPWVPRLILPLAAPSGAITEKQDDKA